MWEYIFDNFINALIDNYTKTCLCIEHFWDRKKLYYSRNIFSKRCREVVLINSARRYFCGRQHVFTSSAELQIYARAFTTLVSFKSPLPSSTCMFTMLTTTLKTILTSRESWSFLHSRKVSRITITVRRKEFKLKNRKSYDLNKI